MSSVLHLRGCAGGGSGGVADPGGPGAASAVAEAPALRWGRSRLKASCLPAVSTAVPMLHVPPYAAR